MAVSSHSRLPSIFKNFKVCHAWRLLLWVIHPVVGARPSFVFRSDKSIENHPEYNYTLKYKREPGAGWPGIDTGDKMQRQSNPTKEQVRQYMAMRKSAGAPPPSIQEIRRQLGWPPENSAGTRAGTDVRKD
jgi:hypothetical protein